jgi:hypothetical protein
MKQKWQDRVIKEREELNEKIRKLTNYIDANNTRSVDSLALKTQLEHMISYQGILDFRIDRF